MNGRIVKKILTLQNLNQNVVKIEYAILGPVFTRFCEIEKDLQKGEKKPFKSLIFAHYGDSQAQGQKPITFVREVLALVSYPALLNEPNFSPDTKERAREILSACKGNTVGAYTVSQGIELIRSHISNFIENRDGIQSRVENIFITTGASEAIDNFLNLFRSNDDIQSGVMIPLPQYPLYSATLAKHNLFQIEYYLDEDNHWNLSLEELQRAVKEARKYCIPRCLVVINPGNPTGQVLSRENMEMIIKFAYDENLVILADEVYQFNIYGSNKFYSFKKVLSEMEFPYCEMELASVMSVSKGYTGECGVRGGYCELTNFDPQVQYQFGKSLSSRTCCSIYGQIVMDVLVNPPKPGEFSYQKHEDEKFQVLKSLEEKAILVTDRLNRLKGVKCNPVQGAMYAFPSLTLPEGVFEAAKKRNLSPDEFYVYELLESSGICVIHGNGFGQKPGSYHFRTTILPKFEHLVDMFSRLEKFHSDFMSKYES